LREPVNARERTLGARRRIQHIRAVLPLGLASERRPGADLVEGITLGRVVVDPGHKRLGLAVLQDIVVARVEVEANVVVEALALGDGADEKLVAAGLLAGVVGLAQPASVVHTGRLVDVRVVDDDLSVDVGCVDPLAAEVLREVAPGLGDARHHRRDDHLLRAVRGRVQLLTGGVERLGEPVRLVLARQHAPELVVGPLGGHPLVGDHCVYIVLLVHPVAQAVIERLGVDRADQALAHAVLHCEALINSLKGRARLWTGRKQRLGVVALALAGLLEFVPELIGSVDCATALLSLVGLVEECDERRRLGYLATQLGQVLVGVVVAAGATNLKDRPCPVVDLDTLRAVTNSSGRWSVVHLPMDLRGVPALLAIAYNRHTAAGLVGLELESAEGIARSAGACFA